MTAQAINYENKCLLSDTTSRNSQVGNSVQPSTQERVNVEFRLCSAKSRKCLRTDTPQAVCAAYSNG